MALDRISFSNVGLPQSAIDSKRCGIHLARVVDHAAKVLQGDGTLAAFLCELGDNEEGPGPRFMKEFQMALDERCPHHCLQYHWAGELLCVAPATTRISAARISAGCTGGKQKWRYVQAVDLIFKHGWIKVYNAHLSSSNKVHRLTNQSRKQALETMVCHANLDPGKQGFIVGGDLNSSMEFLTEVMMEAKVIYQKKYPPQLVFSKSQRDHKHGDLAITWGIRTEEDENKPIIKADSAHDTVFVTWPRQERYDITQLPADARAAARQVCGTAEQNEMNKHLKKTPDSAVSSSVGFATPRQRNEVTTKSWTSRGHRWQPVAASTSQPPDALERGGHVAVTRIEPCEDTCAAATQPPAQREPQRHHPDWHASPPSKPPRRATPARVCNDGMFFAHGVPKDDCLQDTRNNPATDMSAIDLRRNPSCSHAEAGKAPLQGTTALMSTSVPRHPTEPRTKSCSMQDLSWQPVADAAHQSRDAVERGGIEETRITSAQETIAPDLSWNASCTGARAGKAPPEMTMAASVTEPLDPCAGEARLEIQNELPPSWNQAAATDAVLSSPPGFEVEDTGTQRADADLPGFSSTTDIGTLACTPPATEHALQVTGQSFYGFPPSPSKHWPIAAQEFTQVHFSSTVAVDPQRTYFQAQAPDSSTASAVHGDPCLSMQYSPSIPLIKKTANDLAELTISAASSSSSESSSEEGLQECQIEVDAASPEHRPSRWAYMADADENDEGTPAQMDLWSVSTCITNLLSCMMPAGEKLAIQAGQASLLSKDTVDLAAGPLREVCMDLFWEHKSGSTVRLHDMSANFIDIFRIRRMVESDDHVELNDNQMRECARIAFEECEQTLEPYQQAKPTREKRSIHQAIMRKRFGNKRFYMAMWQTGNAWLPSSSTEDPNPDAVVSALLTWCRRFRRAEEAYKHQLKWNGGNTGKHFRM